MPKAIVNSGIIPQPEQLGYMRILNHTGSRSLMGKNGWLAGETTDAWFSIIKSALRDLRLHSEMKLKADECITNIHHPRKVAEQWLELLKEL